MSSSVARMPIKTLVKGGRVEAALQHTIKRCPFIRENQSLLQAKGKPPVLGKSRINVVLHRRLLARRKHLWSTAVCYPRPYRGAVRPVLAALCGSSRGC